MPGAGHNSADDKLRSLVERVERLNEERAALQSDIKDIFAEAKSDGYDVKALRKLISLRKMGGEECKEQFILVERYADALGAPLW